MSHAPAGQVHRFLDLEAQVERREELNKESEPENGGHFYFSHVLSGCSLVYRQLYQQHVTG
jgi:hypothetical protein